MQSFNQQQLTFSETEASKKKKKVKTKWNPSTDEGQVVYTITLLCGKKIQT